MQEVTIVIPNYNGRKLLENCLGTLEKQTVRDFKVLVIDNGSTDHSTDLQSPESVEHLCEKCKSYAANWQPTADEIWSHTKIRESRYENYKDWKPSQPIEK